jgi:hypothetical protein
VYCFYINLDLGPFATKDPRFPLPGNMNIDVNMRSETFQMPENQQSLASAFLDVETNEVNKHQVLAQFLRNTKTDDQKRAKKPSASKSKEMFESAKVQFSNLFFYFASPKRLRSPPMHSFSVFSYLPTPCQISM